MIPIAEVRALRPGADVWRVVDGGFERLSFREVRMRDADGPGPYTRALLALGYTADGMRSSFGEVTLWSDSAAFLDEVEAIRCAAACADAQAMRYRGIAEALRARLPAASAA